MHRSEYDVKCALLSQVLTPSPRYSKTPLVPLPPALRSTATQVSLGYFNPPQRDSHRGTPTQVKNCQKEQFTIHVIFTCIQVQLQELMINTYEENQRKYETVRLSFD